jgi:hypothetical protein
VSADDKAMNRREFFRRVGRGAAMAALAGAAALAATRRKDREPSCINQGVCRGCPAFGGCRLPRARVARRTAERT